MTTDPLSRLRAALSSRYAIERELGRGGMAVVYLAEDVKHGRHVAVKVLLPELAATLGGERFLQEIRVTAKLQHPHILALYDSGEAGGLLYYVMPYVEGESLRDRLKREKQLPVEDALRITEQVASALDFAHRHDVIHRDIKPENILLHEGEAMVADFGIALAVKAAGGERLTETGLSIGTPEYMSPEQVAGERTIDARSDIYSLACVLYEMLAGQPPFTGATGQAVLARHVTDAVAPITTVRPGLSAPVAGAVTKALNKAPADRFESAKAFVEALSDEAEETEPELKSIVVLPFENLSPDPENEYFSDGLTEELIAELSKIRALRVISRTTAMKLKGSDKDVGTISQELKVQYVLEGSVRKAGDALRVTTQLIDAPRDAHLWAERYSGTLDDVFDMQERLARRIVDQLKIGLTPEEDRRIASRPINDVVAYDCYLRAKREFPRYTAEAMDRAIALLEKALSIEGPNDLLFATLSIINLGYLMPLPLREDESVLEKADAYASKVFELNPDSPAGHALRGRTAFLRGQIEDAAKHSREALRLDPSNSDALFALVITSMWAGHPESARDYMDRLMSVDPACGANPAWIEFYSGRFDASIEGFKKEYDVDPDSPYTRWAYASVLAWAGRVDDACEVFDLITQDTPETMHGWFAAAFSRALRGDTEGALRAVTPDLIAAAKPAYQMRWMMAPLYVMLGRDEEALDWLQLAVDRGFVNHPFLEREPFLKRLQLNPRFQAIMDEAKRRSEAFEP